MRNTLSDYLKEIGKRGGEKTKQRGIEYYKAIGRAGALKRWGVKKNAKQSTSQVSDNEASKSNRTRVGSKSDANLASTPA